MIEELEYFKKIWNDSEMKRHIASVQLVHMLEANFIQFEHTINWINNQKLTAQQKEVPFFVPTENLNEDAFGPRMQIWWSYVTSMSTLFFSIFMTSRSTLDNLYRLYLEKTQPKSRWGKFTSIKDGLKKDYFRELFDDIESFEEEFNRSRWIRNCFKAGAYSSSGGVEHNGELFISLLMAEKDKTIKDTSERVSESDIRTAIKLCSTTLEVVLKSN